MAKTCYLCGKTGKETPEGKLTKDHIPPESFFPPGSKFQLITLPCCWKCNNEFSILDEEMVRWITCSAFASEQGRWVFSNKVAHTLQKSSKLAKSILDKMREFSLPTDQGTAHGYSYPISNEVFNAFAIRMCKGILRKFHPSFDYSQTTFLPENVHPTPESNKLLADMLPKAVFDSRGDTVFKFWRLWVNERPDTGAMVFMFYHGAVIIVMFGNDLKIPSGNQPPP